MQDGNNIVKILVFSVVIRVQSNNNLLQQLTYTAATTKTILSITVVQNERFTGSLLHDSIGTKYNFYTIREIMIIMIIQCRCSDVMWVENESYLEWP